MDGEYISLKECVRSKRHLTSVDEDGYCNFCGEQDNEETCPHCGSRDTVEIDTHSQQCNACGKTY